MHISGELEEQGIDLRKWHIHAEKQDNERLFAVGFSPKADWNVLKLLDTFGPERFFGRTEVMYVLAITPSQASELLRKLSMANVIEPVFEMKKGKREGIVFPLCFFAINKKYVRLFLIYSDSKLVLLKWHIIKTASNLFFACG